MSQDPELDALRRAADAILDGHFDEVPLPSVVYHYTSLAALVPIIETATLWCSNVAFANDPAEITYTDEVTKKVLAERFPDLALKGLFATLADIDYYAAAFSAEGDLLPQWRTYAKNGRGIALGFDANAMLWTPRMYFRRVEYEQKRQESLLAEILGVFVPAIRREAGNEDRLRAYLEQLALYLVVLRGIMKHPAYSAEREYRLFNTLPRPRDAHGTPLQFRATSTAVIPFYAVNVRGDHLQQRERPTLREVVLGPCLEAPISEASIRALLDQHKLKHVQIIPSQVRMRPE